MAVMMQDPSQGVHQNLSNHVHLISSHRFPLLQSLSPEQAVRYLTDAPTIVKQTAPMSWTYLNGPHDGMLFLEWISRSHSDQRYPSDGYIWCDPEQTYRHEVSPGYTLEMLNHRVGFRPGYDQFTSHSRTRYHLVSKAPNLNAGPPDPSLWMVHYHQADQNSILNVQHAPISQQMRVVLSERKWLENQGKIERKEFMLHDREHWPYITVPDSMQQMQQQQGAYQQRIMQQQMAQRGYQNFPMQQPPAKRARHSGPGTMPGSADGAHADTSIEDEENTSLGDFFDHLTPREISAARYMQHHRWMEEIFSSPYASNQIVPPDLGLGLMGELKGLTEGLLPTPSFEELAKEPERPAKAKEAQPFTNLKKDQLDEFSKRVEKHLQDGQAEIERMKKEHAEKMTEWKKAKVVSQAEKRLRYATWEGHEAATPAFRLGLPAANGHGELTDTVEGVVKDVESALGMKIEEQKEATMIEKGGLEEKSEQLRRTSEQMMLVGSNGDPSGLYGMRPSATAPINTGIMPSISQQHYQQPPVAGSSAQSYMPSGSAEPAQPSYQMDIPQQTPQDALATPGSGLLGSGDDMDQMDMGDNSLINDMDMDVDTGDIDFIEHTPQEGGDDNMTTAVTEGVTITTPAVAEPQPPLAAAAAADPDASLQASATPVTLGETGQQATSAAVTPLLNSSAATPAQDVVPPPLIATEPTTTTLEASEAITEPAAASLIETPVPTESATLASATMADTDAGGLFDDGTFDDLTNMDDGAGDDGLIDFEGGMSMTGEDGSFGGAMHGTPGNEAGAGEGEA